MRLVVDMDRCTGHGRCYALAPEVFDADDDGYCSPKVVDVPEQLLDQARLGERNCPEEAIALVDDGADAGESGGAS